jgi:hypothetical protein
MLLNVWKQKKPHIKGLCRTKLGEVNFLHATLVFIFAVSSLNSRSSQVL